MTHEEGTRYDQVTVMSYKDPDMAGTASMARNHGKWFVHGIRGETANLIQTTEDKDAARDAAKDAANPGTDGQTTLIIKDIQGNIEDESVHAATTLEPEPSEEAVQ